MKEAVATTASFFVIKIQKQRDSFQNSQYSTKNHISFNKHKITIVIELRLLSGKNKNL